MTAAPFAIVIPTYNQVDLLRRCLASVTAHAPAGTDILVVDDGSPADVAAVIAAFPGVRLLRLPRRRGFCVAANAGIAATKADIVELLNDDAEVWPGWSTPALAAFRDPRVVAVAPLVLRPDGRIDSAGDRYDRGGYAQKIGHGERLTPAHRIRRPVTSVSASSSFYRRSALEAAGGFPEHFVAYFDDVDLSCRLRRDGGVLLCEPESRVTHRGGSSHGPISRRLIERQSCNEERLYWRNSAALATGPRHVLVLAAKAARRWSEGRLLPWAFGRLRAWAELVH